MVRMIGATRDDVVLWMAGPLPIVLMIALVIATFHHLQAGLQVVIEDYVTNDALRVGSILLVKGLSLLLALACIVSVLKLGL
jgi:succinate dehydrogenase / fumarate reductase, membrane anchor subunit